MTDIAIAAASQSPNYSQVAAGQDKTAGGNLGFFEMLLASSSHSFAKNSLLFVTGKPIETAQDAPQEMAEDREAFPADEPTFDREEPRSGKDDGETSQVAERDTAERRDEDLRGEAAGLRESVQTTQDRRSGTQQHDEGMPQAAPVVAPDSTGKAAAALQAGAAQSGGRDSAAKPIPAEVLSSVQAAQGKTAGTPAGEKPSLEAPVTAKTEPAGLVSKPQQALAQATAVASQENSRTLQPGSQSAQTGEPNSPDLKAGSEPVIQRPTAKLQAGFQSAQQAAQGANSPVAGLAAAATATANAQSAVQPQAASAVNAVNDGGPKATPLAASPTGTASQAVPTGEAKGLKPNGFTANLKSTPETFQQLSLQMSRAAALGRDRISLQLHPAELGRVDVKLEFAHDQSMRAVITAERPETLDLLQRDSRLLERALQDAGVKLDNNSLNFAQRNDQQPGYDGQDGSGEALASQDADDEGDSATAAAAPQHRELDAGSGAVNIRV